MTTQSIVPKPIYCSMCKRPTGETTTVVLPPPAKCRTCQAIEQTDLPGEPTRGTDLSCPSCGITEWAAHLNNGDVIVQVPQYEEDTQVYFSPEDTRGEPLINYVACNECGADCPHRYDWE